MPNRTHDAPQVARPLLSRREVGTLLGVSRSTVDRLTARGHLEPVRLGRTVRFRARDVDRLIEQGLNDERPAGRPTAVHTSAEQGRSRAE